MSISGSYWWLTWQHEPRENLPIATHTHTHTHTHIYIYSHIFKNWCWLHCCIIALCLWNLPVDIFGRISTALSMLMLANAFPLERLILDFNHQRDPIFIWYIYILKNSVAIFYGNAPAMMVPLPRNWLSIFFVVPGIPHVNYHRPLPPPPKQTSNGIQFESFAAMRAKLAAIEYRPAGANLALWLGIDCGVEYLPQ